MTEIDLIEFNYQKIIESEQLGYKNSKTSTSQGIMAALALADRRYAEASWRNEPLEILLARLDQSQLAAIRRFREERGL